VIVKSAADSRTGTYTATPDELAAIDEGLTGEAATDEEVEAAFASFRRGIASSLRSSQ
jgi:hypothetical protein